jgi:CRP/FNR family transcriptional regulator, nitrogen oxide reductase regulator
MTMKPKTGLAMTTSDVAARVNALAPTCLDGLAPNEMDVILAAATLRRVQANAVVLREEDEADELFLILEGRARHFTMTPEGKKIVVMWLHPGDTYGGRAMLSKRPMSNLLSTETVEESSALTWKHEVIVSLGKRYPRLMENALSIASDYLSLYRDLHITASYGKASERVEWVLQKLVRDIGRKADDLIELKISNEEVANEANVTIFTVSRLLNEWQRQGLLVKGRGKIMIRSQKKLA